jgi:hypothetical protein
MGMSAESFALASSVLGGEYSVGDIMQHSACCCHADGRHSSCDVGFTYRSPSAGDGDCLLCLLIVPPGAFGCRGGGACGGVRAWEVLRAMRRGEWRA